MKKIYTKPEIMFEDFSLNTNIAGGCEAILSVPNSGNCGFQPEGLHYTIFLDSMSDCQRKYKDGEYVYGGSKDGLCYHVPTAANNVFNS